MAKKRKPSSIKGEQRPDTHSEGEKYGTPRPYDPHFRGPVVNRSCTDVLCCMIFMLFIMAYILLGLAAWVNGDPRRVAYPTDSQGYFCGQKGTPNENKSILFYFNLLTCTSPSVVVNLQCPTTQICVSKCPERFLTYMEIQFKYKNDSKYWTYYSQFCRTTFLKPVETLSQVLLDNDCPSAIYPSKPFLQRCFPDFSTKNGTITVGNKTVFDDGSGKTRNAAELRIAANGINKALDARAIGVKVFEDYATTWYWILIGLTIAMLLSWMFVMLLRFTAGLLFWIFTFGVIGIIAYGIWRCYLEYSRLQEHPGSQLNVYTIGIQTDISMYFRLKQTWWMLVTGSMVILLLSFKDLRRKIFEMIESAIGKVKRVVILCLLELFIILMLIFLRDRIRISIALLKEGSKAIGYIPSTLIYPAITFFFLSVCISYWVVVALYLATSGAPVYKVIAPQGQCEHENKTCDPVGFNTTEIAKACPGAQCHFAFYGGKSLYHQYITTFQLLNLFVFLWLINFVIALGQCALAGAFASYYWALKKPDDIPPYPLFTAFGRAIRYHTGSLAFGSLILAIIQMFRLILEYMDKRLQKAQSNISKFLKCCLRCCFWCLEKAVKFLNRNAYVMMAIYGKNFCKSARDAFNLLMRNILKIAVMDRVTDFVLILGKILVAGCIGVLAFLLFTERLPVIIEGPTSLNYYWVPLLTVIVGSYIIAHGFFSVYAMCIETIFICFLEDLERNDGSAERPYYMSQSLMKIMNKRNVDTKKQ